MEAMLPCMMETVGVTGELKASAPIARKTTAKRENWALGRNSLLHYDGGYIRIIRLIIKLIAGNDVGIVCSHPLHASQRNNRCFIMELLKQSVVNALNLVLICHRIKAVDEFVCILHTC